MAKAKAAPAPVAAPQDKKDEKKEPPKKIEPKKGPLSPKKVEEFDTKVSVREKLAKGLAPPVETAAILAEIRGKPVLYILTAKTGLKPGKGSEVTVAGTGEVWVVEEEHRFTNNFSYSLCYAARRPGDEK